MAAPIKLIDPSSIEIEFKLDSLQEAEIDIGQTLTIGIDKAMKFIKNNFQTLIIDGLILGGAGWKPFVNTAAWKWLNSTKGYGQLGFFNPAEPIKLLNILRKSWEVTLVKGTSGLNTGIRFNWADIAQIKTKTIHPSAGELRMPSGRSWFEWLYAGKPLKEEGYSFKRTGPMEGVRSSAIAGPDAGRMVKGGFWEVSPRYRVDLDGLWIRNEKKIIRTLETFIQDIVAAEVSK